MRRSDDGTVGCLLIGETAKGRLRALRDRLDARGIATVCVTGQGDLLSGAQEGLRAARRSGGACVAAEGEFWAAALALAAQLSVERIVLILPTDRRNPKDKWEEQIERLKGFARRNLFFCVSDVLVLEVRGDERSDKRINQMCRRLCNARVRRMSMADDALEAAARFLAQGLLPG